MAATKDTSVLLKRSHTRTDDTMRTEREYVLCETNHNIRRKPH
jgi:hypothetical protein